MPMPGGLTSEYRPGKTEYLLSITDINATPVIRQPALNVIL